MLNYENKFYLNAGLSFKFIMFNFDSIPLKIETTNIN